MICCYNSINRINKIVYFLEKKYFLLTNNIKNKNVIIFLIFLIFFIEIIYYSQ